MRPKKSKPIQAYGIVYQNGVLDFEYIRSSKREAILAYRKSDADRMPWHHHKKDGVSCLKIEILTSPGVRRGIKEH